MKSLSKTTPLRINLEKSSKTKIIKDYGFQSITDFLSGVAIFKNTNGKSGYLKKDGTIIANEIDRCMDFNNGYGTFVRNGKTGWADYNGIIAEGFEGLYGSLEKGTTDFLFNGKICKTDLKFISDYCTFEIAYQKDKKLVRIYGLASKNGNIIGGNYSKCDHFDKEINGLARFEMDGGVGYVNKRGDEYIEVIKNGKTYLEHNGKLFNKQIIIQKS